MINNNLRHSVVATLVVFAFIALTSTSAHAAPQPGITISPFQQQISIAPDEPGRTFNLTFTNNTKSLQELRLSVRDFGSLNETGGVLLEGSKEYTQKYGLTSWMTLGIDTVALNPGESRVVPVTINNRDSLQPGGHYGAVAANVISLNEDGSNSVAINQQLLSLVLANKVGGERYDLKLDSTGHNGNWFKLPTTAKLRFHNPGNVHIIPRGTVELKSPTGTVVARGIINSESAFILPETYREMYVSLQTVGKAFPAPGLYQISVDYRYEGINKTANKGYPLQFINAGLYGVIVIILSIASYVLWRRKPWHKKA